LNRKEKISKSDYIAVDEEFWQDAAQQSVHPTGGIRPAKKELF